MKHKNFTYSEFHKEGSVMKSQSEVIIPMTKLLFPIMYQGYNNLDEREVNYFALDINEAKNYGRNTRAAMIELHNPILKRSNEWWNLANEFKAKYGIYPEVLSNSEGGLKSQHEFFKFLKNKGYDGISFIHQGCFFYPSIDSQYVIAFSSKAIKPLTDQELDGCAAWFIKELSTHATEEHSRVWLHNLKLIYDNHNITDEVKEFIREKLEEEGLLDSKIDIEFYHQRLRQSVECCGKTQAGKKCTRKTLNGNGLCWQHVDV